jgi:hypothetical protein
MKNIKNLMVLVTLVGVSMISAYYPTLRERLTGDTPEAIEAKDKAAIEQQDAQQKANIEHQKANIQQQRAQQKDNIKYKKKNVEIQAKKQQGKL